MSTCRRTLRTGALVGVLGSVFTPMAGAQETLPFPPTPSASKAGLTMQDSVHQKRVNHTRVGNGQICELANDCLDIGRDLGSPVSLAYFDVAPFAFNGTIDTTRIAYPQK